MVWNILFHQTDFLIFCSKLLREFQWIYVQHCSIALIIYLSSWAWSSVFHPACRVELSSVTEIRILFISRNFLRQKSSTKISSAESLKSCCSLAHLSTQCKHNTLNAFSNTAFSIHSISPSRSWSIKLSGECITLCPNTPPDSISLSLAPLENVSTSFIYISDTFSLYQIANAILWHCGILHALYILYTFTILCVEITCEKSYQKKWDSSHFSRALLQIRNWLETAALHFLYGFSDWHLFSTRTRITSNGPSSKEPRAKFKLHILPKQKKKTRIR